MEWDSSWRCWAKAVLQLSRFVWPRIITTNRRVCFPIPSNIIENTCSPVSETREDNSIIRISHRFSIFPDIYTVLESSLMY